MKRKAAPNNVKYGPFPETELQAYQPVCAWTMGEPEEARTINSAVTPMCIGGSCGSLIRWSIVCNAMAPIPAAGCRMVVNGTDK